MRLLLLLTFGCFVVLLGYIIHVTAVSVMGGWIAGLAFGLFISVYALRRQRNRLPFKQEFLHILKEL